MASRRALLFCDPTNPGGFRLLFLQPHVFLCRAKRHWVILDVNRDKYLCIDRREFEALGPSLRGWEEILPPGEPAGAPAPEASNAFATDLLNLDILTRDPVQAKDARPTPYTLPTDALDPDSPSGTLSCTRAVSFFASAAQSSRQLQRQRFQSTVEFVRTRRLRRAHHARPFDLERARSLLAVFDRLRLFYPRAYLCLFDSLALIHFLARFDLYPDWVFGVNADPFEAHCWVQADGVVLNDTVERVSAFTPIMHV